MTDGIRKTWPTPEEVLAMTPGERIALQWEMSKAEWMLRTGATEEPVFRRDIVRMIRGTSK